MMLLELNIGFVIYGFCILWLLVKATNHRLSMVADILLLIAILLVCIALGVGILVCIEQIIELLK